VRLDRGLTTNGDAIPGLDRTRGRVRLDRGLTTNGDAIPGLDRPRGRGRLDRGLTMTGPGRVASSRRRLEPPPSFERACPEEARSAVAKDRASAFGLDRGSSGRTEILPSRTDHVWLSLVVDQVRQCVAIADHGSSGHGCLG